jgi:Mrp family chromosome partitioning ATPase
VKKRIVKTAFERLHQIKANVLGVVLNDLDRKRVGASYYYDYNRYGGDYYNTEKKSPKPRASASPKISPLHAQGVVNDQSPTTHYQPQSVVDNPNPIGYQGINKNQEIKVTIIKPPGQS